MVSLGSTTSGHTIPERMLGPNWTALATFQQHEKATQQRLSGMSCTSLVVALKKATTSAILLLSASPPGDGTLSRTWVLLPHLDPAIA